MGLLTNYTMGGVIHILLAIAIIVLVVILIQKRKIFVAIWTHAGEGQRLVFLKHKDIYLKQQSKEKLIEHKQYIAKHGEDLPAIQNLKWSRGERQKGKPLEQKRRVN